MSVSSSTSRIVYAGNNSLVTAYAVPFYFEENAHLNAIAKTAAGVETVVTLTNHTGAGNENGGTVRTAVAVPATSTLTIYREVPFTQATSYEENDAFPAASHERALDKLTTITQQLERRITNCIRGTEATPLSPIPSPTGTQQFVLSAASNQPPSWQELPVLAAGPIVATGSTQARFISDRFADVVNVKDFGAVGDGVTDDRAAVVAAFAAQNEVYFPAGTYLIGASATIPADKILRMNGGAVFSVASGATLTIHASFEGNPNSHHFQGFGSTVGIGEVYTEWFGARGDKTTNDQPAFQRAVTCVQASFPSGANGVIRLQSKDYLLASTWNVSQTANTPIDIIGTGTLIGDTRLYGTPTSSHQIIAIEGNTDNIQSIVDFTIKGFSVISQNIGQGTGIYFNPTGNNRLNGLQQSLVENIHILNFREGIVIRNTRLVNFKRISVWNEGIDGTIFANANYCLVIQDGAANTADFVGDLTFDNCQFVSRKDYFSELVRIQASSAGAVIPPGKIDITCAGIRFTECIFYRGGDYSISLFADNYSKIADIWFNNCQLDDTTGISVTTQSANAFITNINVQGTYFTACAGNCVRINGSASNGKINAIGITNNYAAGIFSSAAVDCSGVNNVVVANNRWSGCDWAVGSLLNFSNCNQVVATGNSAGQAGTSLVGVFANLVKFSGTGDYYTVTGNNGAGLATGTLINDTSSATNKAIANNI